MARDRATRRGLGLALIMLSLSSACHKKPEWVVEIVEPSDATVAAADVEIYRSTAPSEDAQLVATAKGRASKSLSIPAIYAGLRDQASELGCNIVIITVGSTVALEFRLEASRPSLIPVPYASITATFHFTPSSSTSNGD